MSTAKKAMLAVLLALTTVCAAVCSLLLAGSVSARAAEDRQPTSIELNVISGTYGSVTGGALINNALTGTIHFNDNTSGSLQDFKSSTGYTLHLPDLNPTEEEAQQESYTRQVYVTYEEGGHEETSNSIDVAIKWEKPTSEEALYVSFTTSLPSQLTAGVAIPTDAFTFELEYISSITGRRATKTLPAGSCEFEYEDGGDVLGYDHKSVTAVYYEGGMKCFCKIVFADYNIAVTEEPIDPPQPDTAASLTADYTAEFQDFVFNNFDDEKSSIEATLSSTPGSNSTITVQAKDAGDYIITFTAKEGYKYRTTPAYATPIPKEGDPETIIGVQYTIHINKVNLTSVTFTLPATSWDYDGTTAGHEPTDLVAVGAGSESINFGTAGENGAVTVTWEYRVKDGEDLPDNEMPTDAGEYQVRAVLSGLKNYNDSNDLCAWQDFEILSKEVALPKLDKNSFSYTGIAIQPTVLDSIESPEGVYTVTNEGGTDRGNYSVKFELKNPKNYHWATPGAGEGAVSGDNGEYYTLTWSITEAKNYLDSEPTVPSWIYNESRKQDQTPVFAVHFKNSGEEPAYNYSYKGWNDGDYSDITDKVNDDEWTWDAGYYQVWVTYGADTSEYGNFAAFESDPYDFTVYRKFVEKPDADELEGSSFEYNEKEQNISVKIPNYEENKSRYTLAGEKRTNAGDYKVTLTLGANYQWGTGSSDENTSDDDIAAVSFGWKITRKVIAKPSLPDGGITVYDPTAPNTITVADYLAAAMTLSGDKLTFGDAVVTAVGEGGVIAGVYTIKVTFNENYCYAAEDSEKFGEELSFDLSWTVQRLGVAKPTDAQDYTYKEGSAYNYELPKGFAAYSVVSDVQTNAGKYDVVFKLDSNYCWGVDGSGVTGNHTLPEGLIIWRAATLARPEINDSLTNDYNGSQQTKTVTGYDGSKMGVALGDMVNSAFDGRLFTATKAGEYTITFSITDNNYTWSDGGEADPTKGSDTVQFTWKINRIQNVIEYPDQSTTVRR